MDTTAETSIISISIAELSIAELRAEYSAMKNLLTNAQAELDRRNQELYDCKRLLKTSEALEKDYQHEIETLQRSESAEQQKLKFTIQKLEVDLAESKQLSTEQLHLLESELSTKSEEIKELQRELKSMAEQISKQLVDDSDVMRKENHRLKTEIETLKEQNEALSEENENLKEHRFTLEEQLVGCREEIEGLKESLMLKRDDLNEANDMINTLQDEVAVLRNELEILQRKPLATDSKGNSLFAEVDDRRLELQKTIQNMKKKYLEMKKECTNLVQRISSLRAENVKLRQCWESDSSESAATEQCLLDSYKSRVAALENIIKSYESEIAERQKISSVRGDFFFLESLIDQKRSEVEALRQELNSRSIRIVLLSDELKSAHVETSKLRVEKIRLEQEIGNLKDNIQETSMQNVIEKVLNDELEEDQTPIKSGSGEIAIRKYSENVDFSRMETRKKSGNLSCMIENIFGGENKENSSTTLNTDVTKKESPAVKEENTVDKATKNVTFSVDTQVEKTADKVLARKGAKVIKSNPIIVPSYKW